MQACFRTKVGFSQRSKRLKHANPHERNVFVKSEASLELPFLHGFSAWEGETVVFFFGGGFLHGFSVWEGEAVAFFSRGGVGGERWYCFTDVVFGKAKLWPFFPGVGLHGFSVQEGETMAFFAGGRSWYFAGWERSVGISSRISVCDSGHLCEREQHASTWTEVVFCVPFWVKCPKRPSERSDSPGQAVPVLPLLAESVRRVAALFKAAGYRSYRNYLSRARDEHLALGYEISPQLERMCRLCRKSVVRGLAGPSSQGGPIFPLALVATSVFFLLREIEAASASWRDVVLAEDRRTVTFTLPSSKTDWSAKGCRRSWGAYAPWANHAFIYHILLRYRAIAKDKGLCPGPLFVDSEGRGCTKGAVVETLRAAVVLTGAAIFDPVGKHLYTGHAFRITGACILSLWGLDAITIQLLGRWGSMAILSYIAEAPLTDLALRLMNEGAASLPQRLINAEGSEFRDLTCYIDMLQETLQRVVQLESGLKAFHGSLCKKAELALVEALTDRVDHTETVLDGMSISLEESAGSQPWYVLNEESRALHRASVDIQSSTRSWATLCGWPFAGLSYVSTYVREEPHTSFRRRHKCYPDEDSESSDDDS